MSFIYGPDGKRVKKISKMSPTAPVETTLYPGADIERAQNGTWTKYPHPDVKKVGNNPFFLHRDHLNTVRAMPDITILLLASSSPLTGGTQIGRV